MDMTRDELVTLKDWAIEKLIKSDLSENPSKQRLLAIAIANILNAPQCQQCGNTDALSFFKSSKGMFDPTGKEYSGKSGYGCSECGAFTYYDDATYGKQGEE